MKSDHLPQDAARLFRGIGASWWVAGGWAIDLWLGKQTREHVDLDLAILRSEQRIFWDRLSRWDLNLGTAPDVTEPWKADGVVPEPLHAVWCRPTPTTPWAFEMLLNESEGDTWLFRRDHAVRLPLSRLGAQNGDGIPFLRPEIVLLYKAKNLRDHDRQDFEQAEPLLDLPARRWLADAVERVHPGHVWLDVLKEADVDKRGK